MNTLHILNYKGNDSFQKFENLDQIDLEKYHNHPPINFHAFAAATNGTFNSTPDTIINDNSNVLVLLKKNNNSLKKIISKLKKSGHKILLAWKETGDMQITRQLMNYSANLFTKNSSQTLKNLKEIIQQADYFVVTTLEQIPLLELICDKYNTNLPSSNASNNKIKIIHLPTPYPIDLKNLNIEKKLNNKNGILIGTREFKTAERRHISAIANAFKIIQKASTILKKNKNTLPLNMTIINSGKKTDLNFLNELTQNTSSYCDLKIISKPLPYHEYLSTIADHRIVYQLDSSYVPGQVAGDCTLAGTICVGGFGEIDRISFNKFSSHTNNFMELNEKAIKLLSDDNYYTKSLNESREITLKDLSFHSFREKISKLNLN